MERTSAAFDLYLLPIYLAAGQEENDLPGLTVLKPPRRVDRSRASDLLLVLLSFPDGPELPPKQRDEVIQRLSNAYYTARGSVTAGLRAAAEKLNDFLLARNQRERDERPIAGVLSLAVLRRDVLYLSLTGPALAYLWSQGEVREWAEPESGIRGLGLGRNLPLRFYQSQIHPGDLLLLCPTQPETWAEGSPAGGHGLNSTNGIGSLQKASLELLRRRLLAQSGVDLQAAILQFQAGAGEIHRLRPRQGGQGETVEPTPTSAGPAFRPPQTTPTYVPAGPAGSMEDPPAATDEQAEGIYLTGDPYPRTEPPGRPPAHPVPPAASRTPPPQVAQEQNAPREREVLEDNGSGEAPAPAYDEELPVSRAAFSRPVSTQARPDTPGMADEPDPAAGRARQAEAEPLSHPRPRVEMPSIPFRQILGGIWRGGKAASSRIDQGSKSFLARVTPGSPARASGDQLSPANLLFIALAVPLIVVAVAVTMYYYAPGGRSQQHQVYLEQAAQFALQAEEQTDQALERSDWTQVIYWLDKAEEYGATEDSQALRQRARTNLDQMDGIERFALRPAVPGGFASSIKIKSVAATTTDAYILDGEQGRVLRVASTGQDYEVDTTTNCGPGPYGTLMVGPLVDAIVAPAANGHNADVLGIDGGGNLVYCVDKAFAEAKELPLPDVGWGEIRAIAYDADILYVLDAEMNRVWLYVGQNFIFTEAPRLFFNNEVPMLSDVVDMGVYSDDLYLLHADGRMTRCTFRSSPNTQTRCEDPVAYNDTRPGRSGETFQIAETSFSRLEITQPFDPSIYILDMANTAVYHFSTQLNMQRQLQPDPDRSFPLPQKPLTAFTITPDLRVFLAFENELFYADLP